MKYTHVLSTFLATAAAKVYTGFNYGALWSHQTNVKRYADFHHGFELAKNLTDTPVPFDSARLYTCITTGTQSDPTEAFQAAIDTGTNLLLGMWISPGASGQPNDAQIANELAALGKGFALHGQKLADLVIGLSVGNEDVYRFNNAAAGVGSDDLLLTVKRVRESIAASPYAKYMQGKPIGHTDTALYAVVPGSDFTGMTAYPYWEGKSIDSAAQSFMAVLQDTQRRAGNSSVWISEMGWPVNGTQKGAAVASAENYQRYWDEVGCQVFGRYNTFWFELLQDSQPDQPDWGLLDMKTHQPRIRDLSCGGKSNRSASAWSFSAMSTTMLQPATVTSKKPTSSRTTHTTKTLTTTVPAVDQDAITLYLTTTIYASPTPTLAPSSPPTSLTNTNKPLSICIVMTDLLNNGIFIPVATHPASRTDACKPPPRFSGSPLTMLTAPTSADSSNKVPSFDIYAPSTPPTVVAAAGPTCVTRAGVLDGRTNLGRSTSACAAAAAESSGVSVTSMGGSSSGLSSSGLMSAEMESLVTASTRTFSHSLAWSMFVVPSTLLTVTTPTLFSYSLA